MHYWDDYDEDQPYHEGPAQPTAEERARQAAEQHLLRVERYGLFAVQKRELESTLRSPNWRPGDEESIHALFDRLRVPPGAERNVVATYLSSVNDPDTRRVSVLVLFFRFSHLKSTFSALYCFVQQVAELFLVWKIP